MARGKIGQHLVLAYKEKPMGLQGIILCGHLGLLGQHLTRQGTPNRNLKRPLRHGNGTGETWTASCACK